MNKRIIIFAAMSILSFNLAAQPFDRAVHRNLWNDGNNAAGLRMDTLSLSYAEIAGNYEGGSYRDTYEASESWTAGAMAKTIMHLENFSMKGAFGFEHFQGYDMCGSIFINPGFFPIDALEFTPGTKSRQKYNFDGEVSIDLSPSLRIGALIDFAGINYAKRKDLRHMGYGLDFKVSPAIQYHNEDFAVGLNYIFGRQAETETALQIGTLTTYDAFLDKGLMYGVSELWNGSGVHLSESGVGGLPLRQNSNGVGVQMSIKELYADAEYHWSYGTAGEKQYIWYRFPGSRAVIRLGYNYRMCHQGRISFEWDNQTNYETSIEKTNSGGITLAEEFGLNRLSGRKGFSVRPEYRYYGQTLELCADFVYKKSLTQVSPMYPYVFERNLKLFDAGLAAIVHAGVFDLGARLRFHKGKNRENSSLSSPISGVVTEPVRLSEWNDAHLEYMCSFGTLAGLSARFNFGSNLYVEASGNLDISYKSRFGAALKFGHNF